MSLVLWEHFWSPGPVSSLNMIAQEPYLCLCQWPPHLMVTIQKIVKPWPPATTLLPLCIHNIHGWVFQVAGTNRNPGGHRVVSSAILQSASLLLSLSCPSWALCSVLLFTGLISTSLFGLYSTLRSMVSSAPRFVRGLSSKPYPIPLTHWHVQAILSFNVPGRLSLNLAPW